MNPEKSPNAESEVYSKYHSLSMKQWSQKESKAGYFGTIMPVRNRIFDAALLRPDLIIAHFTQILYMAPWNPDSPEEEINADNIKDAIAKDAKNVTTVGYLHSILRFKLDEPIDFRSLNLKYVIVAVGLNGLALSGKLANLLAHSGCVVLLQTTEFEYHFSLRLKPWVHYVPITYNTFDIIRKVQWLVDNDEKAYQIAVNAKRFGESYLRLEDYYCYMARLMKELGDLYNGSDATQVFDAKPIQTQRKIQGFNPSIS